MSCHGRRNLMNHNCDITEVCIVLFVSINVAKTKEKKEEEEEKERASDK